MIKRVQNTVSTRFRYLQVTARDAEWGLYCTTTGWGRVGAHEMYPPAEHPGAYTLDWERGRVLKEYQIVSITQGAGVLDTRETRHRVHKGDVLLLMPGVWHRYRPDMETGWHEHWIGFNGAMMQQLFAARFFSGDCPVVHLRPELSLKEEFRAAAALVRESPVGMQQQLAGLVMGMLAKVYTATIPATRRSGRENHVIEWALELLGKHDGETSLEALASQLEVSYSWFRRAFREHVGLSPHQYRLHLQATRAQRLLRTTNFPVKEIAVLTGFRTEQYFCRLLKQQTGRTPLEFRRQTRADKEVRSLG